MIAYYLTHPQVEIDRSVPLPLWGLSARGLDRTEALARRTWVGSVRRIVASEERKAAETAVIIASRLDLDIETHANLGENDRSSTGFLEPQAFEAAADRFFAEPEVSWDGWERATDASARITRAVDRILDAHDPVLPVLFVGHGAVGTLLKCRLAGRSISRSEDQPAGGGNIFAFRLVDRALLCDWTPMESFDGVFDAA
ncbi:histidine phosphatase family protein [Mesorhizobium sp. IMUNJ 23232]|uniref:histidine phosphatase family protein n=1 Tax=Mesorhizobium sp. IMUNJ 23232 TaxID=3376064 RepID=UPI003798CA10